MMQHVRPCLLLAACLVANASPAQAHQSGDREFDPRPSHRSLPSDNDLDLGRVQDVLRDRLGQAADKEGFEKLARELLKNPDIAEKLKNIQALPKDQQDALRKQAEKFAGLAQNQQWKDLLNKTLQEQGGALTEQQRKLIEGFANGKVPPGLEAVDGGPPKFAGQHPVVPPKGDPSAAARPPLLPPSTDNMPPPPKAAEDPSASWFDRLTKSFLNDLNSPDNVAALQDALKNLGKNPSTGDSSLMNTNELGSLWSDTADDIVGNFPSVTRWIGETGSFFHDVGGMLSSFRMPSVSVGSAPTPPAVGGESALLGGRALLLMVLAVGAVVVILQTLSRKRTPTTANASGATLGPWPVSPNRVSTREDVVRAFEYLAQLRLGAKARISHHHAVAQHIGESTASAAQKSAAVDLARCYELARYTPESEPLGAGDLAAARRDLMLLSGTGGA